MKASAPALKAMRPAKFRKAGALPQLNQPPCTGVHSLVLPETRTLREAESAGLCTLQADQNVWGGVRPNLQPGCGRKRFRDRGNFQKIGECQAGEDSPVLFRSRRILRPPPLAALRDSGFCVGRFVETGPVLDLVLHSMAHDNMVNGWRATRTWESY